MKNQSVSVLWVMIPAWTIILVGIGGWITNIVKLIGTDADITAMFILRIVGMFAAPLGAILGFL